MVSINECPNPEWQVCSPEQQGVDSKVLDQGYTDLMSNFPALSQLTVIRHGVQIFHRENPQPRESSKSVIFRRLVASWGSIFKCPQETYLDQIQLRWNIRSAAKSVTSIMVGIALADGVLAHLDHNVAELLPEHFADVSEPAKCQITLRHLLTMTSGLRSVEGGLYAFRMLASRDWSRFMADLPLDHQPGDCFTYNSANPHLFSAVLAKATGKDLLTYAQERLFDPLGITKVSWGAGPEGLAFGGGNLYISSQELAKIGLLYLRGGDWMGQQIVPASWIEESWKPYQTFFPGWDYGYYWYLHEETLEGRTKPIMTFSAAGTGGQKLLLIPKLDLILACVAKTDFIGEKGIHLNLAVSKFLIPAVQI